MARKFCSAEIVPEQWGPSWSPLSSPASHPTIQRTSRNSLVPLRSSFPPKTKLRPSRLRTIRSLDSVDRSPPPISREQARRQPCRDRDGLHQLSGLELA